MYGARAPGQVHHVFHFVGVASRALFPMHAKLGGAETIECRAHRLVGVDHALCLVRTAELGLRSLVTIVAVLCTVRSLTQSLRNPKGD